MTLNLSLRNRKKIQMTRSCTRAETVAITANIAFIDGTLALRGAR